MFKLEEGEILSNFAIADASDEKRKREEMRRV